MRTRSIGTHKEPRMQSQVGKELVLGPICSTEDEGRRQWEQMILISESVLSQCAVPWKPHLMADWRHGLGTLLHCSGLATW
jgi:hypothetical protein